MNEEAAAAPTSEGWFNPSASATQVASTVAVRAEEESVTSSYVLSVMDSLKKKITADRFICIKNRLAENKINLSTRTQNAYNLSTIRQNYYTSNGSDLVSNWLTKRQDDAICTPHHDIYHADKDGGSSFSTANGVLGANLGVENSIRSIKLAQVEKLPPYTTWIYLDRMAIEECSLSDAVLETLAQYLGRTADDIIKGQAWRSGEVIPLVPRDLEFCRLSAMHIAGPRYQILHGENDEHSYKKVPEHDVKVEDLYRGKDLDTASDSLDNLFCR